MFSGENALDIKLQLAFEQSVIAFVVVFPIFLIPLLWMLVVGSVGRIFKQPKFIGKSEMLFFGMVGSTSAYLNSLSEGSLLENVIPSFVVAITFLFQLAGLTRDGLNKPLASKSVFLSGAAAAVCFIFSTRYLTMAI